MNWYNEIDPRAAGWLRELIQAGEIGDGVVDERSIVYVRADELREYRQCHFFAGIGGWSLALRLAGWPDDRAVWTGSCPCQPFSVAGKGLGVDDERHLWPVFAGLIRECKPTVVFGEQVASAEVVGSGDEAAFVVAVQQGEFARANKLAKRLAQSGSFHFPRRWIDGVRVDLEQMGYAFGACDVPAASVGAPHIRQRLYWVADAEPSNGRAEHNEHRHTHGRYGLRGGGESCGMDNTAGARPVTAGQRTEGEARDGARVCGPQCGCATGGVGDVQQPRLEGLAGNVHDRHEPGRHGAQPLGPVTATGRTGHWSDFDIIPCLDGKARRVERGSFPLVDGLPRGVVRCGDPCEQEVQATSEARVMRLRGYGNAIVPELAAEFVAAWMEVENK